MQVGLGWNQLAELVIRKHYLFGGQSHQVLLGQTGLVEVHPKRRGAHTVTVSSGEIKPQRATQTVLSVLKVVYLNIRKNTHGTTKRQNCCYMFKLPNKKQNKHDQTRDWQPIKPPTRRPKNTRWVHKIFRVEIMKPLAAHSAANPANYKIAFESIFLSDISAARSAALHAASWGHIDVVVFPALCALGMSIMCIIPFYLGSKQQSSLELQVNNRLTHPFVEKQIICSSKFHFLLLRFSTEWWFFGVHACKHWEALCECLRQGSKVCQVAR